MENTPDYKKQAAAEALKLISANQFIGLGAGSCVAHLVDMIATDKELSASLTLISSSLKTTRLIKEKGLHILPPAYFSSIDLYFDGCDQFDLDLNALKSGGGIHSTEKILANMAGEFIIIADSSKMVNKLNTNYPVVLEVLPPALDSVLKNLRLSFPHAASTIRSSDQKEGPVLSDYGNFLVNIMFKTLPDLSGLNTALKMIPGVVDHSLFYRMASKAIVAGPEGIRVITPLFVKL